jgi:UDP-glucose 4-epimerase
MRDRALAIWGDGSAVRDYLYVDDLVTLCRRALAGRSHPGLRTFNASTGYGVSLEALLDCVDAVTGRPLVREYRASRRVDVHGIVPDNTAAVETFDWHPSRDLEPGLRHTWHWFSTHC